MYKQRVNLQPTLYKNINLHTSQILSLKKREKKKNREHEIHAPVQKSKWRIEEGRRKTGDKQEEGRARRQ